MPYVQLIRELVNPKEKNILSRGSTKSRNRSKKYSQEFYDRNKSERKKFRKIMELKVRSTLKKKSLYNDS